MKRPAPIFTLVTLGALSLSAAGLAFGDSDDAGRGESRMRPGWTEAGRPAGTPTSAAYAQECSACHMAYQPALLPALAWARIMDPAALASHFGDDASLPGATINEITTYLTRNAADQLTGRRARAFAVGTPNLAGPGETLPRITDTPYFRREHGEIPARLLVDNPAVGRLSQCNRCHRKAAEGDYGEATIDIPGYGRWRD